MALNRDINGDPHHGRMRRLGAPETPISRLPPAQCPCECERGRAASPDVFRGDNFAAENAAGSRWDFGSAHPERSYENPWDSNSFPRYADEVLLLEGPATTASLHFEQQQQQQQQQQAPFIHGMTAKAEPFSAPTWNPGMHNNGDLRWERSLEFMSAHVIDNKGLSNASFRASHPRHFPNGGIRPSPAYGCSLWQHEKYWRNHFSLPDGYDGAMSSIPACKPVSIPNYGAWEYLETRDRHNAGIDSFQIGIESDCINPGTIISDNRACDDALIHNMVPVPSQADASELSSYSDPWADMPPLESSYECSPESSFSLNPAPPTVPSTVDDINDPLGFLNLSLGRASPASLSPCGPTIEDATTTESETFNQESEPTHQKPPLKRSNSRDAFLVEKKRAGMSYKEIKARGHFAEAESTLRGRYRSLTKRKEHRVRKPRWRENDLDFLREAVDKFKEQWDEHVGEDTEYPKVSWKQVGQYIWNKGGSYHFGTATCKKKWMELQNGGLSLSPRIASTGSSPMLSLERKWL